ncbi:hypothetical protein [Erythrobacter sp.]|uniref:hypothetical protein n=1 Tax=Erythrobacter sp. TaxID=1042 RepID=UPI00311F8DD4
MSDTLPDSLQPTAADIAHDKALAAEAQSILGEIERETGQRVKVNTESYNSVTFGPMASPWPASAMGSPYSPAKRKPWPALRQRPMARLSN